MSKHGLKPTREQKKFIAKHGLDPAEWLVERDTLTQMVVVSRRSGAMRTIHK